MEFDFLRCFSKETMDMELTFSARLRGTQVGEIIFIGEVLHITVFKLSKAICKNADGLSKSYKLWFLDYFIGFCKQEIITGV